MITEESLAEFSRRVGRKLRISQNSELACKETIAAFCRGIGDENPLYRDEEHARRSPYGTIVAPPSWLYSVFLCYVQQGLPGVHAFHSGTDREFYKPVMLGDRIRPECVFLRFEEKPSQFSGRMFMEYQEGKYFNQPGELAGKGISWLARAERSQPGRRGSTPAFSYPIPRRTTS
ncbi:MAG: MaoC family dehydratase [Chloroflexota bacterium]